MCRAVTLVALAALIVIGAVAHKSHPRFVHLRGHHGINTEAHPGFQGDSASSNKMQFIVHVRGPVHHDDVKRLELDLGVVFDAYLPHNSFLLFARPSVAKSARLHPLVLWVGEYLPEYKTTSQVVTAVSQLGANGGDVTLEVTLVHLTPKELRECVATIAAALPDSVVGINSDTSLSIIVKAKSAANALDALSAVPAVHTIDVASSATSTPPVLHTLTGQAVELGDAGITPAATSGLDGSGQIIGSGDSGLSTSSCYVFDPLVPFSVSGRIFTSSSHRKLVLYNSTLGDFTDGTAHGTPVVGSAAGSYYTASDALNNYEGIAPASKVAFLDLQSGANSSLNIPGNLESSYFGPLVTAGAKVILSAWGSYNSRRLYTVQEQAVDAYLFANPTVIALFSAGNDGSQGPYSINSPASSKNAIAVGASQTIVAAYDDAFDPSPYVAVYNNYNTRLCGTGTLDPLWSDETFCQGVAGVPAPCDSTERTQFCTNFAAGSCCSFPGYKPFTATCCVQTFLDAINKAPNSYSVNNLASFSSRGPTFDGRIKPDVTAPGESVKTAAAQTTCPTGTPTDSERAAQVTVAAGTSIAVGNAAGAVALIRQYFQEGYWPQGYAGSGAAVEPDSALVKALLVAGAQPLDAISGVFTGLGTPTWGSTTPYDGNQGFGRIQLATSLFLNSTAYNSPFSMTYYKGSLATGESWETCINFPPASTGAVTIALVWTDPAAAASAGLALVNNLDLSVSYQLSDTPTADDLIFGATVVYPNGQGQPDNLNNVERIVLNADGQRKIRIHVYGGNVPKGPQQYYLVIAGDFVEGCSSPFLCPRSCSGAGTCDTSTGVCTCSTTGVSGPDCTASLTCGTLGNCSGNGVCNSAGECLCANGFDGDNCETSLLGQTSSSTVSTGGITKKSGIRVGVFVGVVIALFLFGCILALFIGVFGGLKYAEWRRQKTKAKANRMLSNDSRL